MTIVTINEKYRVSIDEYNHTLEQCNYVWSTLNNQMKDKFYDYVVGGGCFLK